MKTNTIVMISTIIIAAALLFSGISISRAIVESEVLDSAASNSESLLMDEEGAAAYLGLKLETFRDTLKEDNKEKQNRTVYPTYKYVPYMVIEGNKYFNRSELEKWVEFNMHNK